MSENKVITPKPVKITETILRDAHQSLIATRMPTEIMLPIIDKMDEIGYNAVECWGGATFDSCLRFLKEDPWERLRKLKAGFKKTKLQMLLRGQNLLGYSHYADDVVEYFVQKSIANGIDIIRIFDCLNDLRNLETSVKACKKEGGHSQIALSYTIGSAYNEEYWMNIAKDIENMGADSICIKDMAGLLVPYEAEKLIRALKSATELPIELHTHYTSGCGSMTYMKAAEAGVDIIDCAISPFALGTSQPATEVMVGAFEGTPYDTGLSQAALKEIADHFTPYREECLENGLLSTKGASDRLTEVLEEVPRVREDLGQPPLVTPSSQIVGTQAVMNVLMGERYKVSSGQTKDLVSGHYGRTTLPIKEEVRKKIIGDQEPITCRPADLIEPQLAKFEQEVAQWKQQDEDVLSYALFPQVAVDFFKYRQAQQTGVDVTKADTKNGAYPA